MGFWPDYPLTVFVLVFPLSVSFLALDTPHFSFISLCPSPMFPQEVHRVYKALEAMVFDHYIRLKTLSLNGLVSTGLFQMHISNATSSSPSHSVRKWVLEVLVQLVSVHEEVFTTARGNLSFVLEGLIERLAMSCLEILKQIDSFPAGGMLPSSV